METGILKHIVIEAIQRALILGNGHKRIALHQFRHHHGIVRLAVLVIVQILRQHDGNMAQLVRRCFGGAKKMNPENVQVLSKLFLKNSVLAAGDGLNFKIRRTSRQPESGHAE